MKTWKTSRIAHFFPNVITLSDSDITILSKAVLTKEDTIPLSLLASVSLRPGLFFSSVVFETSGAKQFMVKFLRKKVARDLATSIKQSLGSRVAA